MRCFHFPSWRFIRQTGVTKMTYNPDDIVIISGCRTPIGKFQGGLSDLSATQLGAIVVREAV
ncbi:MAG: thiolase family protein, partial [Terriglobales bacterium]